MATRSLVFMAASWGRRRWYDARTAEAVVSSDERVSRCGLEPGEQPGQDLGRDSQLDRRGAVEAFQHRRVGDDGKSFGAVRHASLADGQVGPAQHVTWSGREAEGPEPQQPVAVIATHTERPAQAALAGAVSGPPSQREVHAAGAVEQASADQ